MRKVFWVLAIGILILTMASVSLASMNQFAGKWINADPNTRGVTTLDIQVSGTNISVQAWGKCHPTDCDWGRETAAAYAPDVSSNLASEARAVSVIYNTGFSQTIMIIKPSGNQLKVETFTSFTDSSGRSGYNASYTFNRSLQLIGPIFTPGTIKPIGLATPQQYSPANGTTFGHYPRTTTLKWNPVSGASSYTVEIDCYHCCQNNAWCTDVGQTYLKVPGITNTFYTFDFAGANPGRWRVWAVGSGGQESAKSGWWEFKYTQ